MKRLLHHTLYLFNPVHLLACLVTINGYLFLHPSLHHAWHSVPGVIDGFTTWKNALLVFGLLEIPRFMLGLSLMIIGCGLLLRARIAWAFSLLLLLAMMLFELSNPHTRHLLLYATLCNTLLLLWFWRRFHHASLAAGSLFALLSMTSLLLYGVLGSLYLGEEFRPHISDLSMAFYYSIVSMSTAGFGDIVPLTPHARLFTVSIILLGITVFATSVSVIIGPVLGGNMKRIIKGRFTRVMRKNHFIIAGATPLAHSVYLGLKQRGEALTVIVPEGLPHQYPPDTDLVIGDPSSSEVLTDAGSAHAKFILALRNDDSENAFIVLAAKEAGGSATRTICLVNDSQHLQKIKRVQPDIVISLQLLGSEFLVRTLSGETIDNAKIAELFFGHVNSD